jgi:prepilin-type N-terminal cleavage/methylation domain-containing protein
MVIYSEKLKMKSEKLKFNSKAFTLIEMIFVIVILAFIAIGSFNLISKLFKRNYIAKTSSDFEYFSQQLSNQLSILLYNRIPLSVIGYDGSNFKYIGKIDETDKFPIIEWISELDDAKTKLNLSGFADLYDSSKPTLKVLDFNSTFVNDILHNKFSTSDNLDKLTAVIFAGTFDMGEEESLSDDKNAFGWHGHKHKYVFTISDYKQDGNDCNLKLDDTDGKRIYEKFYLADTAYTLALGKDIDTSAECIKNLHIKDDEIDNTLFLFYNYRPWKGDTFCADNNGTPEGNVTVLAQNVKGFKFKKVNSHLEMFFTFFKSRGDINISVSKQKVVF